MTKKISKDEFLSRFYFRYPQARIEIIKYTAISKPATVKCLKCGKVLTRKIARQFLNGFDCCGENEDIQRDQRDEQVVKTEEARQIEIAFDGHICLLTYCGTHKPSYYRCLDCGKIFKKNHSRMLESKGCPICKQRKCI